MEVAHHNTNDFSEPSGHGKGLYVRSPPSLGHATLRCKFTLVHSCLCACAWDMRAMASDGAATGPRTIRGHNAVKHTWTTQATTTTATTATTTATRTTSTATTTTTTTTAATPTSKLVTSGGT